ncbi:hypothetical protein [Arthrobacter humicola]
MDDDEVSGWVRLLRRAPRWALVLGIAVVYTVFMLGMKLLQGEQVEPIEIAVTGALGLAVGGFALWFTRRQRAKERQKPEGWPTGTNLKQAVSKGRLPEGAAAEQWIPELTKIAAQERYMIWAGPLLFGAFAAMGVFLTLENPDHPWFWVLATIGFAGVALWYPIWIPRRRTRIEGLIAQFPDGGHLMPDESIPEN